jgi:hypothetical protein
MMKKKRKKMVRLRFAQLNPNQYLDDENLTENHRLISPELTKVIAIHLLEVTTTMKKKKKTMKTSPCPTSKISPPTKKKT